MLVCPSVTIGAKCLSHDLRSSARMRMLVAILNRTIGTECQGGNEHRSMPYLEAPGFNQGKQTPRVATRPICSREAPMSSGSFHGMNGVCLPKVEGNGDLLGWYLSFVLHVRIVFCCVYCSVLDVSEDMRISNTISNKKHVAKNCLAFPSVSQLCHCLLVRLVRLDSSRIQQTKIQSSESVQTCSDILRLHRTT